MTMKEPLGGIEMNSLEPFFSSGLPLREADPEPQEEKDELLSLKCLSHKLRISQKWLREECSEKRLPHLDAGGRLLFSFLAVKQRLLERAAGSWGVLREEEGR
jgi:hypothetical protein